MDHRNKNKRKGFYSGNFSNKKIDRDSFLKPGIRGFICSCNGFEKDCIRESLNILNEFADKLFGEEKMQPSEADECNSVEKEDEIDAFERERQALKQLKNSEKRFCVLKTGIPNCIFIQTNLPNPAELTDAIMRDLYENKKATARHLIRMIPVEVTCKAYIEDIMKHMRPLMEKYLTSVNDKSFAIILNKRCNSNINRDALYKEIGDCVNEYNESFKVNLSNPDITIMVEVIKNICGICFIKDYQKLSKYNIRTLCGLSSSEQNNDAKDLDDEVPPKVNLKEVKSDLVGNEAMAKCDTTEI